MRLNPAVICLSLNPDREWSVMTGDFVFELPLITDYEERRHFLHVIEVLRQMFRYRQYSEVLRRLPGPEWMAAWDLVSLPLTAAALDRGKPRLLVEAMAPYVHCGVRHRRDYDRWRQVSCDRGFRRDGSIWLGGIPSTGAVQPPTRTLPWLRAPMPYV